ncbi:SCO family protein [Porticoccaceae bacterium]|nr:SCO family protein [Porticoccaceae bacterium]MDA8788603.1 SCO family protein [Porticoccaceae bacterium]MDB2343842.1 SCO family protein [Porticoccaceae bacterium]MDB2633922.1 SCO family protein [Porticoccaceae bacterium]MDB2665094.1 SCO family protein [Porticoccaceae bacterium]
MTSRSNWLLPSLIIMVIVSTGVLFSIMLDKPQEQPNLIKSPTVGGDFVLRNIDGRVSLEDFRGSVVILYFGFLSCPEVCPTSMSILTRSLEKLSPAEKNKTKAILISIDPQRDNFQELLEFTNYYHPNILGVTGTEQEVEKVAQQYGAFFEITASETVDSAYAYRHSSRYYIIDQQGNLIQAMRHSTTPNELAARIKKLFQQSAFTEPS